MNIIVQIVLAIVFLMAGFAAGFPIGKSLGFSTGGEWALMQANIIARESGLLMPVTLEDGQFRVIIKQPRNLYRKAWQLADRHDGDADEVPLISQNRTLRLAQNAQLTQ